MADEPCDCENCTPEVIEAEIMEAVVTVVEEIEEEVVEAAGDGDITLAVGGVIDEIVEDVGETVVEEIVEEEAENRCCKEEQRS